ncbi:MAG TPA: hypothetical protein VK760_11440 [Candidatus Acidoferrales bacterium]|jgi:hypothetical protein|nr:hypothetical protein [Candidatus Acidoferrales bacterium]
MPPFGEKIPALSALLLAAVLAGATPAPPSPVGLSVQTHRDSFDLLDGIFIELVAHNPGKAIRTVEFAQPTEYEIDVVRNGVQLWSSLPPSPPPGQTYVAHARAFNAGATPVVIYDWNEVTAEHWSPLPGKYTIRAALLTAAHPSATTEITFVPPLPTTALSKLKPNEAVTMAGRLDATRKILTDSNGSVVLTRGIPAPPDTPIVVRGFATDHPNASRTFTMQRWASLGGPLPTAAPIPIIITPRVPPTSPIPSPKPSAS